MPLDRTDYMEALKAMTDEGWTGAKIYDALLLQCAAKCGVDRIYTFNLADFRLLASPNLQGKIRAP